MARASTHSCANCAASLRIPQEHERYFRCEFCGTVLEDRNNDSGGTPDIGTANPPVEVRITYPVANERPGVSVGGIVTTTLLVAIGVVWFLATASPDIAEQVGIVSDLTEHLDGVPGLAGGNGSAYHSLAAAMVVASDDDTSPDVVALGSTSGGDMLSYLDEEAPDGIRWTLSVPAGDGQADALLDGQRLYVLTSDRLSAYNRGEGVELWSVPLEDTVQAGTCQCVRLVGGVVVVLTSDGSLTAYDPADGTQRWSVELAAAPTQVMDVGGAVGTVDRSGDRWVLRTRDAATGDPVHDAPLSCRVPGDGAVVLMGQGASLTEIGGGSVLFFGWSPSGTCVARWDPGQDAPAWDAGVTLDFFSAGGLTDEEALQVGDHVYIGQEGSVTALSLVDGRATPLVAGASATFWPVALRDEVLVVAAESLTSSGQWELQGLDTQTANVRWVVELDAAEAIEYGQMTLTAGDTWFAVPAADGIGLVQFTDDLAATVRLVPPGTGTAGPAQPLDVPQVAAGFVKLPGSRGNDVWLALDGRIIRFDVTDGTTTRLP